MATVTTTKKAIEKERLSLQKAFEVFQRQSDMLENSHSELKNQLREAHLDLEEKNRQLTATKEKLSGILESISDAVFLLNADGAAEPANESAVNFLKQTGTASEHFAEHPAFKSLLKRKEALSNELAEIRNGFEKRHYLISTVPLKSNSAGGTVISMKDVTELMALQERVGREDRMAALGQVAASVAHEIRNPLGAIEGFGMLLERDLKDHENLRRLASKTIYAARQLNSVVGNLLSYTKEIKVDPSENYIRLMLDDALEFVRPIAEDRGIEIICGEDSDPLQKAFADAPKMRQVLINVLLNAAQACPHRDGGCIRVIWKKSPDGQSELHICDNGPGIPKELKNKIFEPFFTCRDGGTGLGLSLCRRIVEAHEGEVVECGKEGEGADFMIRLNRKAPNND